MTARTLPPPVPVTALRVYEPLDAFDTGQRAALAALADQPEAGRQAEELERRAAWRQVLAPPRGGRPAGRGGTAGPGPAGHGLGVRTGELRHARVLRAEGVVLLAPVLLGFDDRPPGEPASGDAQQGGRRHTLVRAWEIPVAWVSIVRREDLTRSGGRGRYVLPMARARIRAARTLRTLRAGLGDVEVTLDVETLARWLEQFHPRSWVELDARPVAALVGGDDGADDVRLGLESLTVGDAAGVAAAYARVRRRSQHLEQLSVSS